MIKVFGHLSPDTDATGSAILWAWYLNTHTSHKAEPFVLGSLNKETTFMLERWKVPEPALLESINTGEDVAIVDTNNPQELFPNILDANILQIIDHHKLVGGLSTKSPVEITMKPHASTASVIFDLISQQSGQGNAMGNTVDILPNEIAGILLTCILSDTLEFRSPTTTPHDKAIAEKLATKLGLNITDYANEMFAAKSDVSDFTDTGLIHIDSKKYAVGDKNFRVSVVETTNAASILARKDGIVEAIKNILAEENDINDILFFVIDILKEEATVLTYNDLTKGIIEASFGVTVKPGTDTEVLPGIVSRKKQILPVLKLPEFMVPASGQTPEQSVAADMATEMQVGSTGDVDLNIDATINEAPKATDVDASVAENPVVTTAEPTMASTEEKPEEIPYFEDKAAKPDPASPTVERSMINAVVYDKDTDSVLCLDWQKLGVKTFVMGGIENGEDSMTAAAREIKEETGYKNVKLISEVGQTRSAYYAGHKKENRISNTTGFLFMLSDQEQDPVIEAETTNHTFTWVPRGDVSEFISVDSQKYLWEKALLKIEQGV